MRSLDLTKLQESNRQKWLKIQRQKEQQTQLEEIRHNQELLKEQLEAEKIAAEIATEQAEGYALEGSVNPEQLDDLKRKQLDAQIADEEAKALLARERANAEVYELQRREAQQRQREQRRRKAERKKSIQFALITFLKIAVLVLLLAALTLGLYRMYRWVTEEPLIKEIETLVEVPVEKRVEVPVETIVEKEVIPDECTQIRRNGKIYIDCDGVKIDGANTIGNDNLEQVPELLQE